VGPIIVNAVYELDQMGVAVVSLTEQVDTTTGAGRFMLSILAGKAGMERTDLLQRSWDGTNTWARQGVWLGASFPMDTGS
jgi:DNA invertase Pin-like site-specific DNA recombinase